MNFFITGVSGGFGKELALHYVKSGHKVFGFSLGVPDEDNIGKTIHESDNFLYFKGSVNNDSDVDSAIKKAIEYMSRIDVLINNAAYKTYKLPEELSEDDYKDSVITNLLSPILLCRKILPEFINRNSGYIINIASNAGMTYSKMGTAYNSTKAGLITYTLSLAEYLKGKNISVNVISPPTFTTSDYRKNFPAINHKKLLQSERVIEIIDYIIFNKKLITGKNFPMFRLKTLLKFTVKKNIEFIKYLFQPR